MQKIIKCFVLAIVATLTMSACSVKSPIITEQDILQKGQELEELTAPRTVRVVDEPYLGSTEVPLTKIDKNLSRHITLNMVGSLGDVCASATNITGFSWYVEDEQSLSEHVKYTGSIESFCRYLSLRFGYVWRYDDATNSIVFSRFATRTFTLLAAPGTINFKNQITNESEGSSSSSSDSGTSTTLDTAQNNTTKFDVDVWGEAVATIKGLLTKEGNVSANLAAGTITVTDEARALRKVEDFIKDYNDKLCRQVALQVRVWQLTIEDENEVGLNLQAMFDDGGSFALASGTALDWSTIGGELSASITDGKLKDSSSTLKALSTYGKTSLVTSGSGVTMNNQPLPVQNITRDTYIASMSLSTTDYSQTSEITPGEVVTGFAMTVIPHILDRRTVILQYNASLNSLDALREYSDDSVKVEMPKISSRAFSQRVTMRMGQTLVLAGFEQESHGQNDTLGALQIGRAGNYGRTLIIITISVEDAMGYTGGSHD